MNKKTKNWLTAIVIILVLGGLTYLSQIGSSPSYTTKEFTTRVSNTISIDQAQQDLGDIPMSEGDKTITYTIKNTGKEPLLLGTATTSCMCTNAILTDAEGNNSKPITMHTPIFLNQELGPNEEITLTSTFDPNAHGPNATGPITRSVFIETNSTQTPTLKFSFLGNVVK